MKSRHIGPSYDLVSPDGKITKLKRINPNQVLATIFIENIDPSFVGFQLPIQDIHFNLKSTLAQVGIESTQSEISLDNKAYCAEVNTFLTNISPLSSELLKLITIGAKIGKLFAMDERRKVRNPDYLSRMFGRSTREGKPLLSLGGFHGSQELILDKIDGYAVAYLSLQKGVVVYEDAIRGLFPTIAKSLCFDVSIRNLLALHQQLNVSTPRTVKKNQLLLVRTLPLHIHSVFAKVVDRLLLKGFHHTAASILQPDTSHSGDIYEFYGNSEKELTDIPLEFYTLEPYREHIFFVDRDHLQTSLEDEKVLFNAFKKAPKPITKKASVFIVKDTELKKMSEKDWIVKDTWQHEFPGLSQNERQALMVNRYIQQQPCYPFLKKIEDGTITSQGILLTRYFPSPLIKQMLLTRKIQHHIKRIYFQYPSKSHGGFFSQDDRNLLQDLEKFGLPVYWVDPVSENVLKYVTRQEHQSGMFVPIKYITDFLNSTVFGVYGSNLLKGNFQKELEVLLKGILNLRVQVNHPLLCSNTPLALVTGGGPGVMKMGNQIAQKLKILSCANIVDFTSEFQYYNETINEQKQNPYIDAKMIYSVKKLVERQAEFHLDFPIFLMGGVGTDFEFSLEEVRRKVGSVAITPCLLFGACKYWENKISQRFQCNKKSGTIKGSEWISNCFFNIKTAEEGLIVYEHFFKNTLKIGPDYPHYDRGFVKVSKKAPYFS